MSKSAVALCVTKPVDSVDHRETGAKMRSLRIAAGVSLTQMADRLPMNLAQLSQMETGKRPWDEEKAARYVSALNAA